LAAGPDRTALTFSGDHGLSVGTQVKLPGTPNRTRHYVSEWISDTSVGIEMRWRPSKGFRRHNRRIKARSRAAR